MIGSFVVAVVLVTGFVFWERHTDHPLFDVTFFANPRFTAASIAVTLVFFAMFGAMFFLSQYLQFVLGFSALKSGAALLPVAAVLMIAAPLSATLVARIGTKIVVTVGLVFVAIGLAVFSLSTTTSGYPLVALVLVIIGFGMGLAMAPATDSIMGSLPLDKAGVGSAMNDTTREIGGALGVAVLGSITAAAYSSQIVGNPSYAQLERASPKAAAAVADSVGAASIVAAELPAKFGSAVTAAANEAFINAIDRTVGVGAIVALAGALVALKFLPAHAGPDEPVDRLIDGASARLPEDPETRLSLARATLELLADAGMSSLTYNAVAARSGIATATLERYGGTRVDAVADALAEVYATHPVPDTGDLRRDLRTYLDDVGSTLSLPRTREVLGALVAEAATDPALATVLRDRVVTPRRRALATRLDADAERLAVPVDAAVDQLVGPLYFRALLIGEPVDEALVAAIVDRLLPADRT